MATGGLPRDHPIYFTLLSELNALRKLTVIQKYLLKLFFYEI